MTPQLAEKLMAKKKLMKEFVFFIRSEAVKLNTLEGIEAKEPQQIAIEIEARKLAYKKLSDILEPLLNSEKVGKFNNQEYNM